jgi:23S rRNA pseudouridine2604 synthase
MSDEGIRLAKRVAALVPCSRAEAERYIAGGWVAVDGVVVEDPATRVTPERQVALLPGATPVEPPPVTLLLHKPAGLDTQAALALFKPETLAEQGRGKHFLQRHLNKLAAVAPLKTAAEGLVVFTQDYRVVRKFAEDAARLEHEYVVEVGGAIADGGLQLLNRGALKASWQSEGRLRLAGKGIEPGQIDALCAQAGLQVRSIRRLRIGRVSMAGLPLGRWRYLHDTERF